MPVPLCCSSQPELGAPPAGSWTFTLGDLQLLQAKRQPAGAHHRRMRVGLPSRGGTEDIRAESRLCPHLQRFQSFQLPCYDERRLDVQIATGRCLQGTSYNEASGGRTTPRSCEWVNAFRNLCVQASPRELSFGRCSLRHVNRIISSRDDENGPANTHCTPNSRSQILMQEATATDCGQAGQTASVISYQTSDGTPPCSCSS